MRNSVAECILGGAVGRVGGGESAMEVGGCTQKTPLLCELLVLRSETRREAGLP